MRIAYYRVSSGSQSIDAQRSLLGGAFDREYSDEAISGATPAAKRPGFVTMMTFIREGDELFVTAIDRLGRDAIDVQTTVRDLLEKGVQLDVRGLGRIAHGVGELIVAVLAQIAEMERQVIRDRTAAGRDVARKSLIENGVTHRGKTSLGRPLKQAPEEVRAWREINKASIVETAAHFGVSVSTAKRYLAHGPNPSIGSSALAGEEVVSMCPTPPDTPAAEAAVLNSPKSCDLPVGSLGQAGSYLPAGEADQFELFSNG